MAGWNNIDDGLTDDEPSEDVEPDVKEMIYFENLVSSNSTTVKVYESEVSLEDISIVKDSVGAHIMIIHDQKAFSQIESMSEKIVQDEEGDSYCIIFISQDVVEELQRLLSVKLDYQDILKKEDIEHETSNLLAG